MGDRQAEPCRQCKGEHGAPDLLDDEGRGQRRDRRCGYPARHHARCRDHRIHRPAGQGDGAAAGQDAHEARLGLPGRDRHASLQHRRHHERALR